MRERSRRHLWLPRRDSRYGSEPRMSRHCRSAPMHSTIDIQTDTERVPPLPGSLRCEQRFVAIRLRSSPNDRRTQPARMSPPCGPGFDLPAWPLIPLALGAIATGQSSAGEAGERDWRELHRPPDRCDRAARRAAKMPQLELWAPEPGTSVQWPWNRDSGPSKRMRLLTKACGEADTLREEGCREGATLQRAIFLPDVDEGGGGETLAHQNSAFRLGKFSLRNECAETSLGAADTSVCATLLELRR
jgi:hypothetical protein